VRCDESRNVLLEVLHPIETTLELRLHITDALRVNLSHSQDAPFILLQGNGVLFVGVLHNTNKVLDGFPNHGTSIHVEHHERGRFRPNSTDTLADLGKNLLKSGEATTKRCHIRIIIPVAEAIVGHKLITRFRNLR
jgi:hypothetical protein